MGADEAPPIEQGEERGVASTPAPGTDSDVPAPATIPPVRKPPPVVGVLASVERLRTHVATLPLNLDVPGVLDARREREKLLAQFDDYLLPRLRRRDAPLLAVIGGSTGAGKSTLTNSLVRRMVSRSGVLRPTTRSPVLVHHPMDSGAFLSQRILPGLTRVTSEAPEPSQPIDPYAPRVTGLRLVPHDGLAPGLAIIDAPDIDSLVETNRELAVQLLAAADLWVFVTTATRYADAMPWQMLRQAVDRGVAVAIVMDRIPPDSMHDLRIHLATLLSQRGLSSTPVFTIPESELSDGFLPWELVSPLLTWLRRIAADSDSRALVANRTLNGVLASIPDRARQLAVAADQQAAAHRQLRADLENVFAAARTTLLQRLVNGSLLRGDVLTRWQAFIGGEFVRRLDAPAAMIGDRVPGAVRSDPDEEDGPGVSGPVTEAVVSAVEASARAAADQVLERWQQRPAGASLLVARASLLTPSELDVELAKLGNQWQERILTVASEMLENAVDEESELDAGTVADVLAVLCVNERLERGDSTDAGGPGAAAAPRILGAVLGEDQVREAAAELRTDLAARARVILDAERVRLERVLMGGFSEGGRGAALRSAAAVVEEALR